MISSLRVFSLCVFFLAAAGLSAAPKAGAKEPPPPLVRVTFLLLNASGPDALAEFSLRDQRNTNRVRVNEGAAAGPYEFVRGSTVELFDEEALPVPANHPVGAPPPVKRVPQVRISLPAGAKNVLVLLGASMGKVTQHKVLDQSLETLPAGHLVVVSFVPDSLLLRIGKTRQELAANGRVLVPVSSSGPAETVLFQVARKRDAQWQKVVSQPLTLVGGSRRLMVLIPGGEAGVSILHLPPAVDDPVDPPPPQA
jgi:hypothetical protein